MRMVYRVSEALERNRRRVRGTPSGPEETKRAESAGGFPDTREPGDQASSGPGEAHTCAGIVSRVTRSFLLPRGTLDTVSVSRVPLGPRVRLLLYLFVLTRGTWLMARGLLHVASRGQEGEASGEDGRAKGAQVTTYRVSGVSERSCTGRRASQPGSEAVAQLCGQSPCGHSIRCCCYGPGTNSSRLDAASRPLNRASLARSRETEHPFTINSHRWRLVLLYAVRILLFMSPPSTENTAGMAGTVPARGTRRARAGIHPRRSRDRSSNSTE